MKLRTFLFYLFIFLLPWQTRYMLFPYMWAGHFFEYASFSIYAVEFVLWLCIIASLPYLKRIRIADADMFLCTFLFVAVVVSFFASEPALAFVALFRIAEGVLLYFSVRTMKINWVYFLSLFTIAGVMQAILAFVQIKLQYVSSSALLGIAAQDPHTFGVSVVEFGAGERFLRAYGSFPHPNMLGGFLVAALCAAIMLYAKLSAGGSMKLRAFRYYKSAIRVSISCMVIALLLSFSRSAWIGYGIMLVFFAAVMFRRKDLRHVIGECVLITLIVTALFGVALRGPFFARIQASGMLERQSIEDRMNEMSEARALVAQRIVRGVGVGNYTLSAARRAEFTAPWFTQPVHSAYILVFLETGLLGVIFWLYFLSLTVVRAWKNVRNQLSLQAVFPLAAFLALCAINALDHYQWTLFSGIMLFWAVLGLAARNNG